MTTVPDTPLYIVLISVHGLIRGTDLELGRDADTGGQIKYVVELATALAAHPRVGQVDLLTRRVVAPEVDASYAAPEESLGPNARIVRLDAGPEAYIRKEELWDHLDSFADNALDYLRRQDTTPAIIHSHYADAGYVGLRVAKLLGLPLVHTGHSLGRVKRRRLLAAGMDRAAVEDRYTMSRRIEAEEETLATADLVIASTHNEIEEQYGLYDYYQPDYMAVVPPGTDLIRFHPPGPDGADTPIAGEIRRFLAQPEKPLVLALSRPDERKNIETLVQAYGDSARLRDLANLAVVAGNRDDIREMDSGPRRVLKDLLYVIDVYDLYGKIAYPKHHRPDDVPDIYRFATTTRGVFVNPALTEPFGLTLIEAAACGLPLVATEDGGPRDIIGNCDNGLLVDPLDPDAIADRLLSILEDPAAWARMSANGLDGVNRHYSWQAHADAYVQQIAPLLDGLRPPPKVSVQRRPILYHDRAVISDLDQNLLGDTEALAEFAAFIRRNRKCAGFGVATGRRLDSALRVLRRHNVPLPDFLITSAGTEIHYAPRLSADKWWASHIDHNWQPRRIRTVLDELPGLERQPEIHQSRYKMSYYIDPELAPDLDEINSLLYNADIAANALMSFGQFLDILPARASKGLALRYVSHRWDIPLEKMLVAGGSGADEDMMRGNTLAVVVANRHHEELSQLTETDDVYFAHSAYSRGIIEAIDHYDFYGACRVPDS